MFLAHSSESVLISSSSWTEIRKTRFSNGEEGLSVY